jgi:glycosyltransferase involved in cell wall biosynthesis
MNNAANPLISVVIPTYNHARYLGRALQSVLNQNYTNWEAIVIDNHSTDNTDKVMTSFSDSRITYLKIHNNGVIAASRNAGIRVAKGIWIAFLDSDDWWTSDKLRVCVDYINKKEVDLVYHDLKIINFKHSFFQRKAIKSWQVKKPVLIDLVLNGNAMANSAVVVRKSLIEKVGGINESIQMVASEDYNTWLRIAQHTNRFLYLPNKLGFYFIHDQSVSKKDMSLSYIESTKEFIDRLEERHRSIVKSKAAYLSGRYYYLKQENKIARTKLIQSLLGGQCLIRFKSLFMLMIIVFKVAFNGLFFRK